MSGSAASSEGFVLAKGGGRQSWFLGGLLAWKANGIDTDNRWELVEQRGRQGFAAPFHAHSAEAEGFYVLEGELTFHIGDKEVGAGPGSFAMIPAGIRHAFVVESPEARFLTIISPAGLVEFFDGLGKPALRATLPPLGDPMPTERELAAAAERSGQIILGPPPKARPNGPAFEG